MTVKANNKTIPYPSSKKKVLTRPNYLLFAIWPFMGFLSALKGFHLKSNRNVVYLFLALFGFTFVLGNEAMDSYSYAQRLKETALLPFSEFWNVARGLYEQETTLDIMMPLVNFIVSRFTSDHRILFGVWALIFGFFYLKSINLLHERYFYNRNINALFFLVFFIFLNPITNINGFRMWTAAWIFFYGAYHVVLYRDIKYLFLAILSVLFHFSFLSASLILVSYYFLGNRNLLFYLFLAASVIIPEISIEYARTISDFFGEGVAERAARYTGESAMEGVATRQERARELGKWYLYLPSMSLRYFFIGAFFYVKFQYSKLANTAELKNLYSFGLLFLGFANFVAVIPSMGRFYTIFYLFVTVFVFNIMIRLKTPNIQLVSLVGLIPFFLMMTVFLRVALDIINPWLFTFLPLPFIFDDTSLYQFLFN